MKSYVFEPVDDLENEYAAYDTRILARRGDLITLGVNCSQLFETIITSDQPFSVRIRPHSFDETRATPKPSGDWLEYSAEENGGEIFSFNMEQVKQSLICGYPTNFSKADGKNFYHGQHIVALRYLAKFGHFENRHLKDRLRSISEKWRVNTINFSKRPLSDFQTLQTVLDSINRGKLITQATILEELGLVEYAE